jgi:hypothetical protein
MTFGDEFLIGLDDLVMYVGTALRIFMRQRVS